MPEGGILLDLTSCRDWGMVQDAIRRAFGFPAHYGENWVAMWDCLTGLFWVTDDRHIVVRGLDALPPDLRNPCARCWRTCGPAVPVCG